MSAFGRLWRRAPAWRVCVITGVAFVGLAAMFPPPLPRFATGGLGGGTSSPADGARFHPRPDPAPANYSGGRLIPDGAVRSGVIRVAGHDVPLPAGNWRSVGVAREGGADQLQIDVLARIENASLTGLMLIVAPTAMSGVAGPVGEPPPCADPGKLGGHDLPPRAGDGPLTHACWAMVPQDMRTIAAKSTSDLIGKTLAFLGDQHVRVPDNMLSLNFYASNDSGWELEQVMIPDPGGVTTKVSAWADRFLPVLRRGYESGLSAADLTPGIARDPVRI